VKATKVRSAAVVTVFDAPKMDKRGRKRVAKWLREQAEFLEQYGQEFAGRFTARYLYK
jgi:hypothetical protein